MKRYHDLPGHQGHEGVRVQEPMTLERFWELVDLATEGDINANDVWELLSEVGRGLARKQEVLDGLPRKDDSK